MMRAFVVHQKIQMDDGQAASEIDCGADGDHFAQASADGDARNNQAKFVQQRFAAREHSREQSVQSGDVFPNDEADKAEDGREVQDNGRENASEREGAI